MNNWEFQYPWLLLLVVVIPIYLWLYVRKNKKNANLSLPTTAAFSSNKNTQYISYILPILRSIILLLLIVAFAKPRIPLNSVNFDNQKGIDIFMVVDVSLSMLSKDLKPDRITAVKDVAKQFTKERVNDRVGLLSYAAEAITKVPLTTDRDIVTRAITNLNTFELQAGTAIGVGLATAVNHLKNSKAKSKVIILLTDGENNSGSISPEIAADIAKNKNIKVYTIGIGKRGETLSPTGTTDLFGNLVFRMQPSNLDEELLQYIAQTTGGKYFRATSKSLLKEVYEEINQLERTDIKNIKYLGYKEQYRPLVFWALGLLLLELLVRTFYFRSV